MPHLEGIWSEKQFSGEDPSASPRRDNQLLWVLITFSFTISHSSGHNKGFLHPVCVSLPLYHKPGRPWDLLPANCGRANADPKIPRQGADGGGVGRGRMQAAGRGGRAFP